MVALALAGCASVPRDAGFSDVRQDVSERAGYEINWYRGAPEEAKVGAAVDSLLRDELTIDEAVQIALLNNRRLQAVYEDLGVAQADVVQAGLLRNPIFGGGMAFSAGEQPELAVSAAVDFLGIFYIPLRKRVAESRFEAAKSRVAGAVLELAAQVQAAFYEAQARAQLLEMRQQVALATEAAFDASQRLREAGNIRLLDLHSEQALYEQARLDLLLAEEALTQSREQLNRLMGLWGSDTVWQLNGRLPAVPEVELVLDDVESRAIANSLDLAVARQEIETYGRLLGLTRASSLVPDLEIGGSAEREENGWKVGPELAVPIPLFDQGQARVATARAELRRRQEQYVALAVEVRAAAREVRQRLITSRRTALHYQNVILPLRARITEEAQHQYNAMQIGVFQLLQARQQEIEAGQRYIEALGAYWRARTDLEVLLQGRMADLGGIQPVSTEPRSTGADSPAGGH